MGMLAQGSLSALTGKAVEAVPMLTSGLTALRSMEAILHLRWYILSLARAYRELGLFDSAWRCVSEAITTVDTTKERWLEAEVYRTGGEIARNRPSKIVQRQRRISSVRSRSHVNSKQSPGNYAPQ